MSRCVESDCHRQTRGDDLRCLQCQAVRLSAKMADQLTEADDE